MLAIKECLIREGVLNLVDNNYNNSNNNKFNYNSNQFDLSYNKNNQRKYLFDKDNDYNDHQPHQHHRRHQHHNYQPEAQLKSPQRYQQPPAAAAAAAAPPAPLDIIMANKFPPLVAGFKENSVDTKGSSSLSKTELENSSATATSKSATVATAKNSCCQSPYQSPYQLKKKFLEGDKEQEQQQQQNRELSSSASASSSNKYTSRKPVNRYQGHHPHFHHHTAPAYYTDLHLRIHTPNASDVGALNENYQSVYTTPSKLIEERHFPKSSTAVVPPPPIGGAKASSLSPSSCKIGEKSPQVGGVSERSAFFRGGTKYSERRSADPYGKHSPTFAAVTVPPITPLKTQTQETKSPQQTPPHSQVQAKKGDSFDNNIDDIEENPEIFKHNQNKTLHKSSLSPSVHEPFHFKPEQNDNNYCLNANVVEDCNSNLFINTTPVVFACTNFKPTSSTALSSNSSPFQQKTASLAAETSSPAASRSSRSRSKSRFANRKKIVRVRSESRPISALYDIICKEKGLDLDTSTSNEDITSPQSGNEDQTNDSNNNKTKSRSSSKKHQNSSRASSSNSSANPTQTQPPPPTVPSSSSSSQPLQAFSLFKSKSFSSNMSLDAATKSTNNLQNLGLVASAGNTSNGPLKATSRRKPLQKQLNIIGNVIDLTSTTDEDNDNDDEDDIMVISDDDGDDDDDESINKKSSHNHHNNHLKTKKNSNEVASIGPSIDKNDALNNYNEKSEFLNLEQNMPSSVDKKNSSLSSSSSSATGLSSKSKSKARTKSSYHPNDNQPINQMMNSKNQTHKDLQDQYDYHHHHDHNLVHNNHRSLENLNSNNENEALTATTTTLNCNGANKSSARNLLHHHNDENHQPHQHHHRHNEHHEPIDCVINYVEPLEPPSSSSLVSASASLAAAITLGQLNGGDNDDTHLVAANTNGNAKRYITRPLRKARLNCPTSNEVPSLKTASVSPSPTLKTSFTPPLGLHLEADTPHINGNSQRHYTTDAIKLQTSTSTSTPSVASSAGTKKSLSDPKSLPEASETREQSKAKTFSKATTKATNDEAMVSKTSPTTKESSGAISSDLPNRRSDKKKEEELLHQQQQQHQQHHQHHQHQLYSPSYRSPSISPTTKQTTPTTTTATTNIPLTKDNKKNSTSETNDKRRHSSFSSSNENHHQINSKAPQTQTQTQTQPQVPPPSSSSSSSYHNSCNSESDHRTHSSSSSTSLTQQKRKGPPLSSSTSKKLKPQLSVSTVQQNLSETQFTGSGAKLSDGETNGLAAAADGVAAKTEEKNETMNSLKGRNSQTKKPLFRKERAETVELTMRVPSASNVARLAHKTQEEKQNDSSNTETFNNNNNKDLVAPAPENDSFNDFERQPRPRTSTMSNECSSGLTNENSLTDSSSTKVKSTIRSPDLSPVRPDTIKRSTVTTTSSKPTTLDQRRNEDRDKSSKRKSNLNRSLNEEATTNSDENLALRRRRRRELGLARTLLPSEDVALRDLLASGGDLPQAHNDDLKTLSKQNKNQTPKSFKEIEALKLADRQRAQTASPNVKGQQQDLPSSMTSSFQNRVNRRSDTLPLSSELRNIQNDFLTNKINKHTRQHLDEILGAIEQVTGEKIQQNSSSAQNLDSTNTNTNTNSTYSSSHQESTDGFHQRLLKAKSVEPSVEAGPFVGVKLSPILRRKSTDTSSVLSGLSPPSIVGAVQPRVSILKKKDYATGESSSTSSNASPVTFSASVIDTPFKQKRVGILKKRCSLDESRSRSHSPDERSILIKSTRRNSFEELPGIGGGSGSSGSSSSNQKHQTSGILKQSSYDSSKSDGCPSATESFRHSILKKKDSTSTPSDGNAHGHKHVSISQAVILAAAELDRQSPSGNVLKETYTPVGNEEYEIRPILKQESTSSDDIVRPPKPILKKKSSGDSDEHEIRPILKTSRKSSREESFDAGHDEATFVRPILKTGSPSKRRSLCGGSMSGGENDFSSPSHSPSSSLLKRRTRSLERPDGSPIVDLAAALDAISVSQATSLASTSTSPLPHPTVSTLVSAMVMPSIDSEETSSSSSVADRIKNIEALFKRLSIIKRDMNRDRYKTQPITKEEKDFFKEISTSFESSSFKPTSSATIKPLSTTFGYVSFAQRQHQQQQQQQQQQRQQYQRPTTFTPPTATTPATATAASVSAGSVTIPQSAQAATQLGGGGGGGLVNSRHHFRNINNNNNSLEPHNISGIVANYSNNNNNTTSSNNLSTTTINDQKTLSLRSDCEGIFEMSGLVTDCSKLNLTESINGSGGLTQVGLQSTPASSSTALAAATAQATTASVPTQNNAKVSRSNSVRDRANMFQQLQEKSTTARDETKPAQRTSPRKFTRRLSPPPVPYNTSPNEEVRTSNNDFDEEFEPSSLPLAERLRFFSNLSVSSNTNNRSRFARVPLSLADRSHSSSLNTTPHRFNLSSSSCSITPTPMDSSNCSTASSTTPTSASVDSKFVYGNELNNSEEEITPTKSSKQNKSYRLSFTNGITTSNSGYANGLNGSSGQENGFIMDSEEILVNGNGNGNDKSLADFVKAANKSYLGLGKSLSQNSLPIPLNEEENAANSINKRIKLKTVGKLMMPSTFLINDRNNNKPIVDKQSQEEVPLKIGKLNMAFIKNFNQQQQKAQAQENRLLEKVQKHPNFESFDQGLDIENINSLDNQKMMMHNDIDLLDNIGVPNSPDTAYSQNLQKSQSSQALMNHKMLSGKSPLIHEIKEEVYHNHHNHHHHHHNHTLQENNDGFDQKTLTFSELRKRFTKSISTTQASIKSPTPTEAVKNSYNSRQKAVLQKSLSQSHCNVDARFAKFFGVPKTTTDLRKSQSSSQAFVDGCEMRKVSALENLTYRHSSSGSSSTNFSYSFSMDMKRISSDLSIGLSPKSSLPSSFKVAYINSFEEIPISEEELEHAEENFAKLVKELKIDEEDLTDEFDKLFNH